MISIIIYTFSFYVKSLRYIDIFRSFYISIRPLAVGAFFGVMRRDGEGRHRRTLLPHGTEMRNKNRGQLAPPPFFIRAVKGDPQSRMNTEWKGVRPRAEAIRILPRCADGHAVSHPSRSAPPARARGAHPPRLTNALADRLITIAPSRSRCNPRGEDFRRFFAETGNIKQKFCRIYVYIH